MSIKSEVAEILDELMLDVLQEVSKKYGIEIYSQTFPDERATQILQLLKDKLPKEKVVEPPVGEPWHIRGYDVGYDAAINEIRELLGDGTK